VARDGDSGHAVRRAWEQISTGLQHSLDQITVESLASNQGAPMFYI
jgi:DNA-binding IscR family transcriptional regulator